MRLSERLNGPRGSVLLLLVAIAVAVVLLVNSVLAAKVVNDGNSLRRQADATAAQLAMSLSSFGEQLKFHAAALGADPANVAALTSADPALLAAAEQASLRAVPAAESIQLLALGSLGIADSTFKPATLRNHIEVAMAGTAFKGGVSRAETYADADQWLLTVAAPVRLSGQDTPIGVLVVRTNIKELMGQFILPQNKQGEYSLWASPSGSKPVRVATAGDASTESEVFRVSSGIGNLQAGFSPTQSFIAQSSTSFVPLLLFIVCGGAVLAGITLFAARQAVRQLREDAAGLEGLGLKQHASTAAVPKLNYAELKDLAETVLALRRDQSGKRQRDTAEASQSKARLDPPGPLYQTPLEIMEVDAQTGLNSGADSYGAVPDEVFRDYDIRGLSAQFSPELAYQIGQAIGSEALELKNTSLVVGIDGRDSSPRLREQMVRGLLSTGIDIIDLGTVATPMLYFACHHLQTMTGVMITGSHNSAEHNGFKIMISGETLCGDRIKALRRRILDGNFREGQGSYRVSEIDADYLKAITDDVLVDAPLKVVLDCGNGSAAVVAVELFQQLGCQVIPLFCELDGSFPNHAPDPSVPGNLRHLLAEVAKSRADLGIAFDGDGDRIGVVTGAGRIVGADRLLMLFARDVLSRHPGADIVFDVKCSGDLSSIITQNGGGPIMCRSGHSWIKEKMKETGAQLGGEFTGHICFRDRWFGFDDALYAAARLLEILTAESRTLDEMIAALPQTVSTPEIRIELPEERKFAVMEKLAAGLAFANARLLKLDGVRAEFPDGWGLVRASNTSAALILRFEAQNEAALTRIESAFRTELTRLLPADIAIQF